MSDWEAEDIAPAPVALKDSWSDEEEEEVEEQKPSPVVSEKPKAQSSPPSKKKKTLAQKIAERKEEEERKRQESLKKVAESEEDRKMREQNEILEADLENAKDLFGGLSVSSEANDSEQFVKLVLEKISAFESSAQYFGMVESLVRDLCAPLNLDETRKISTVLSAQINEKQKAFSNKKKKTTKKAQLKGTVEPDMSRFEEDLYAGEYDDFM